MVQLQFIGVPDTLTHQAWLALQTVDSIVRAITAAPLGLNPRMDGADILVPVPR